MARWGGSMASVVLIGMGAYTGLVVLMLALQGKMLYQPDVPTRALQGSPADIGLAFEAVQIVSEDGVSLSAWHVPAVEGAPTVLFAHGNAGNISHRLQTVQMFHDMGLAVLIFDYRGYGESAGTPSEVGTYRDALAMWHYLVETRGLESDSIVVAGRSLGGAVAAWLAAEVEPGALILESSFTSIRKLSSELYPFLPGRWLSRFDYDAEGYLAQVSSPVLVMHGRGDDLIPIHHGQQLYGAAPQPKTFVELDGGHNDAFLMSSGRYREAIMDFLAQHLKGYLKPVV